MFNKCNNWNIFESLSHHLPCVLNCCLSLRHLQHLQLFESWAPCETFCPVSVWDLPYYSEKRKLSVINLKFFIREKKSRTLFLMVSSHFIYFPLRLLPFCLLPFRLFPFRLLSYFIYSHFVYCSILSTQADPMEISSWPRWKYIHWEMENLLDYEVYLINSKPLSDIHTWSIYRFQETSLRE